MGDMFCLAVLIMSASLYSRLVTGCVTKVARLHTKAINTRTRFWPREFVMHSAIHLSTFLTLEWTDSHGLCMYRDVISGSLGQRSGSRRFANYGLEMR